MSLFIRKTNKASPVILGLGQPGAEALATDEVRAIRSPFSQRLSVFGDDTSNVKTIGWTASGTILAPPSASSSEGGKRHAIA